MKMINWATEAQKLASNAASVTRLGDLSDFGQLFKPLATIN